MIEEELEFKFERGLNRQRDILRDKERIQSEKEHRSNHQKRRWLKNSSRGFSTRRRREEYKDVIFH